jgi:hypothetical protein
VIFVNPAGGIQGYQPAWTTTTTSYLSSVCVRGPPSRHFLLRSPSMDSIDYPLFFYMVNGWKHVVWNNIDQNERVPVPFQKICKSERKGPFFDISLRHLERDGFIVIFNIRIFFKKNNLSRFDETSKVKLTSTVLELGWVTLKEVLYTWANNISTH